MATEKPTQFQSFEFTKEEYETASLLTPLQRQLMQTHLAEVAEQKLAITYDPMNPLSVVLQEADLKGKIDMLNYILSLDSETRATLKQRNSQTN